METEPGHAGREALPALVAQRVTASVQRRALQLVRLETEREAFLTTPEHPFATPRSGWVGAGRLVPGDWVVSERFGAVRLRSVRGQPAARPVPVFNLSVASSHAYFVGTERVLVHNTTCHSDPSASPKEADGLEETIEHLLREREKLNREIAALTPSPRVAEVKAQRKKVQKKLDVLRARQRGGLGPAAPSRRGPQKYQAQHETARKALEDARQELAELENRTPNSETEKATYAARRESLQRKIPLLQLSSDRTGRIVSLLGELELTKRERVDRVATQDRGVSPAAGDSRALGVRQRELRAELSLHLKRERDLRYKRRKRADPEWREKNAEYCRKLWSRLERTSSHLADSERPRDRLELLESELVLQLKNEPSESRQVRIDYLNAQIDTMKELVGIRRKRHRIRSQRHRTQQALEKLSTTGRDTSEVEKRLEQLDRERRALRLEQAQLRVKLQQLALLDPTPGADAPGALDGPTLRELERRLADGLTNDQQLADIEEVLAVHDFMDFDWLDALRDEAQDVDEALNDRELLTWRPASPERSAALQSSYGRLQQELREERNAVKGALAAMANEHAHIQTTQASSSSGPAWQARLKAIQEEQAMLLAQWRARLHMRLDSTRRQLSLLQNSPALRDDEVTHDLEREIALLERELQVSG